MQSIVDIVYDLARQHRRGEESPLLALHSLAARPGERISHLAISQRLSQAWVTLTGEPFRQHQSLALSALRRGEPFALVGGGAAARRTAHLLVFEVLQSEPQASVLIVLPDAVTAAMHLDELEQLNAALGKRYSIGFVGTDSSPRRAFSARILLTTPSALHKRLLRYHERAWRGFWARLRFVLLTDMHHYQGIATAHVAALLLRASRLASPEIPPLVAATVIPAAATATTLANLNGQAWRLITVDDTPRPAQVLAFWRNDKDYIRETATLALALERAGMTVQVVCTRLEMPLLEPLIGSDQTTIRIGTALRPAQVYLFAGYPESSALLLEALEFGADLSVIVLGNAPLERTVARLASQNVADLPMLNDPPPTWVTPPINAYAAAQHLLCAAFERPLTLDEVTDWQAEPIVAHLVRNAHLVELPDEQPFWQPAALADDDEGPYEAFDLNAVGGSAATIYDDQGTVRGTLDPVYFDRWAFLGASLPFGHDRYQVAERDLDEFALHLHTNPRLRRTFPLRRGTVQVREEREQRDIHGRSVGWGRVITEEVVYGYYETTAAQAVAERALSPTLTTTWSAPAIWITLGMDIQVSAQMVGWSLAAVLPLRLLCQMNDVVPFYQPNEQRLYIVDAHPGGNGLAQWLYTHLEELLPLAYDVALDCRSDPLLEPLARVDMDWLLVLLGGSTLPVRAPVRRVAPVPVTLPSPAQSSASAQNTPSPRQTSPRLPDQQRQELGEPLLPAQRQHSDTARPERPTAAPAQTPQRPPSEPELPANTATNPVRRPEQVPLPEPTPVPAAPERRTAPPTRSQSPVRTPGAAPPPSAEPNAVLQQKPPARHSERQTTKQVKKSDVSSRRSKRQSLKQAAPPTRQPQQPVPSDVRRETNAPKRQSGEQANATVPVEPARPTLPPTPPTTQPPADPLPDAAGMVDRLRRLREQREHHQPKPTPRSQHTAQSGAARFAAGDQIFCTPYGQGEVVHSELTDDSELLTVRFAEHGMLTINPSVSAVRRIEPRVDDDDF